MLLFTGVWGFVWLTCFSYLTSKWNRTYQYLWRDFRSTVEAPLAFAFFCLVIYVCEVSCLLFVIILLGIIAEIDSVYCD